MRLAHQSGSGRSSDRSERGETLIELLATIILMGTGCVAILTGLVTLISVSDQYNQNARANLAVYGAAEALKSGLDSYAYQPCATPTTYPAFADLPNGYTATVAKVRYWNGTVAGATRSPVWVEGSCTAATDKGLQELTITIDSGPRPRRATETIVMVKRDARCLVTYDNADGKPC